MSKIIVISGSPSCGKTVTALKLAETIYNERKATVMFLSADMCVPSIGYLLPHYKNTELSSIGEVLDHTDIYTENVLAHTVTVKNRENFGILAFKTGENRFSYPAPTEDKIQFLLSVLQELAQYIIVDCSGRYDDIISQMAMKQADTVIQLIAPDLKCMSYYAAHADMYATVADKSIQIMNITDRDVYLPIEDVKKHFKKVRFVLPYSLPLKQQTITGLLTENLKDAAYCNVMKKLTEVV